MRCSSSRVAKPSHQARSLPQRPCRPAINGPRISVKRAASDSAQAATETQPSADTPVVAAAPAPATPKSEEERFHEAYAKAYTMSQLYVKNRPPPVPQSEYEARRKKRDMEDILTAARRRGKKDATVKANLEKLESILPDLINLNRMKASDWVLLSEDVNAVANKLITLKELYPTADVFTIAASRPRTLLQSDAVIRENAAKVRMVLSKAKDIDAIITSVPELMDATALVRSLFFLQTSFPDHDPVELLQENPLLLLNLGESNMEDNAEYGEMTTKD